MKITVIGLGLIGGSVCKAIKKYTQHEVLGYGRNKTTLQKALDCNAIDEIANTLNLADMTIVCTPPENAFKFMQEKATEFKKGSIVIDVCGVKGQLAIDTHKALKVCGVNYVGTHPMAGKERFGFDNSTAELFQRANFIVTPLEDTDKQSVEVVVELAKAIGFGRIIHATPFDHDKVIAYTSQLAHIVSNAYVKSPTMAIEFGFSGGSFQDMTRVATVNEDMWTDLFFSNRECLMDELDILLKNLQEYKVALQDNNPDMMRNLLRDGRILKEDNLRKHGKL
jgi:prephenate dehydrogenase